MTNALLLGFLPKKKRTHRYWSKALIIKLIGHVVGYNFLVRQLRALWQIKLTMDVIDVGNDVYVVRFSNMEEYDLALSNGPWIIADHYLVVPKHDRLLHKDYKPNFFHSQYSLH
ncbi:hypothetical protein DITRI_Ditri09bG0083300 [Diplodiscus trichospermus]